MGSVIGAIEEQLAYLNMDVKKNQSITDGKLKLQLGMVSEYYVMYELAKRGIWSIRLPVDFDYDLLTSNGLSVEVKSARKTGKMTWYKKPDGSKSRAQGWSFANHKRIVKSQPGFLTYKFDYRKRICDFYVFVCYDENTTNIEKVFIVPNDESFPMAKIIRIPASNSDIYNGTNKWLSFLSKWKYLTK